MQLCLMVDVILTVHKDISKVMAYVKFVWAHVKIVVEVQFTNA